MIFDNFKIKKCEKCGQIHEPREYECPKCRQILNEGNLDSKNNPLKFLNTINLILIFVLYIVCSLVLPAILSLILIAINHPEAIKNIDTLNLGNYPFETLLSMVIGEISLIGLFVVLTRKYLKRIPELLKRWKHILIGIGIGLIFIAVSFGYSILIESLNLFGPGGAGSDNQDSLIKLIKMFPVLSFFALVIFGPISEEIIFRVGLFGIGYKFNKWVAYIATIIIFTLLHLNFGTTNPLRELAAVPTYLIGAIGLCFVYDKFGFTAACMFHIINNLASYIEVMIKGN